MSTQQAAIVIGASGGIGSAMLSELLHDPALTQVFAISRAKRCQAADLVDHAKLTWLESDSSESSMVKVMARIKKELDGSDLSLRYVVVTIGSLHDERSARWPEKRLAELELDKLEASFRINCHLPMLWLKHCHALLDHKQPCDIAVLSARVGSISDNQLGGWYAYRSAKAALNMQLKTYAIELKRRYKSARVISFHPGTTDTALSKPYQAGVPSEKLFKAEFVAQQLKRGLLGERFESQSQNLSQNQPQNIEYLDWQLKQVPW